MEACPVPDLLNIFTKIVCDRNDYCFVCLRTSDERRLVTPNYFKKFVTAFKINTNGELRYICHICERQASNALKIFRAAVFASSVNLILKELSKRDILNNSIIFEKKYFKRVLNKTTLSTHLTPEAINEEVSTIRKYSQLTETDTLIMDNKQAYESPPTPTVVAMTSQETPQVIIQCPSANTERCSTPAILPDKEARDNQNNKTTETYVILDDEDDPLKGPPPLLQPANVTQNISGTIPFVPANLNSNLVVTSNPPNLVTFEELMRQPQHDVNFLLHPIFLSASGQMSVPSLSAVIINESLVVYDSSNKIIHQQPLGVDVEEIKKNLLSKNEVFIQNCDVFKLQKKDNDLIVLNTNVNSQNFIGNQQLILNPNVNCQNLNQTNVLNSNTNTQNMNQFSNNILNSNIQPANVINSIIQPANVLNPNIQPVNVPNSNVNCQTEMSMFPNKKMKVDGSILNDMLTSKPGNNNVLKGKGTLMKNVKISDISSDMDNVPAQGSKSEDVRTDWEDKIPMDVISFVDAVDPNAHSVLQPKKQEPLCTMKVGDVRSLAPQPSEVIDLC